MTTVHLKIYLPIYFLGAASGALLTNAMQTKTEHTAPTPAAASISDTRQMIPHKNTTPHGDKESEPTTAKTRARIPPSTTKSAHDIEAAIARLQNKNQASEYDSDLYYLLQNLMEADVYKAEPYLYETPTSIRKTVISDYIYWLIRQNPHEALYWTETQPQENSAFALQQTLYQLSKQQPEISLQFIKDNNLSQSPLAALALETIHLSQSREKLHQLALLHPDLFEN